MEVKTVGVACDHAGFALKKFVLQYLEEKGYPSTWKRRVILTRTMVPGVTQVSITPTSVTHWLRASRVARFILVSLSAVLARVSLSR